MAGEPFTLNVVPKTVGDDPQDLKDWIYAVAIELEKTVQTDITASNGVILVGTDFQHEDTSEITDQSTTGAQVVDTITFDTFGHVQSFTTRELTASDINAEPAFTKNTAFNKNFGTDPDTVLEGDTTAADIGAQPLDDTLTTIAATDPTTDQINFFTGTNVASVTSLTAFGRSLIDDASASAARTTLGLVIGTDVQAWDTELDTYAANPLTSAELGELQNINLVTITNAQWVFLGNFDQALTITSNVTFNDLTINGDVTASGSYTNTNSATITLGAVANEIRFQISSSIVSLNSAANASIFQFNTLTKASRAFGTLTVDDFILAQKQIACNDTTESTSTTTGSIQTDGGLGVAKNIHGGGDLTIDSGGEAFLNLPTVSTGTSGTLWSDSGTVKVIP